MPATLLSAYAGAMMTVVISMLRGVNVGSNNRLKMDALRDLCTSLDLQEPQTYIQSGNVVFKTRQTDLIQLAGTIECEMERRFGFRSAALLRTVSELREVAERNPFANRPGFDGSKLLVTFLSAEPAADALEQIGRLRIEPEEFRASGRELYSYYPNGMARPKLSPAIMEKTLRVTGTGRNWNSVLKMLEMAEKMEAMI